MMHAHTHAFAQDSPALWIGLVLLLVGGLWLADRRRAWHRAVFTLALLVAVFGLESAVHSVHHLGDPEAANACALLSGSKHVDTASPSVPDAGGPLWTAPSAVPAEGDPAPLRKSVRTYEGRAPPARSAV